MNAIKHDLNDLVTKELVSANEKFPLFSSVHHSYAVILEEVDECRDALKCMEFYMRIFWNRVKKNDEMSALSGDLEIVKKYALGLAAEAIQVAAMCEKFNMSFVAYERGGRNDG